MQEDENNNPESKQVPPRPYTLGVQVPSSVKDTGFWKTASLYQFIYSIAGLILGTVCIIGGIILFFHGITGSISWTAKLFGMESNISDAAPGAVLFIVGLFIVLITSYQIRVKK